MKLRLAVLAALASIGSAAFGFSQAPQSKPGAKPLVDGTHRRMQPEEALKEDRTLIFGDPDKPGFYIYRNRFHPGVMTRPHIHDQDRWVTVIKGTWWTDEGDVYRPDKTLPVKTGGVMFHPKGLHHYDGARDEETIVQIMGMGPVHTTPTEVDAKGQPVPAAAGR
jgi:hypothetical protein